mgnify:CR=1 FL=1
MADFKGSTYLSNARKKKDEYNKDYTESSKVKGLYNSWQSIGKNKPGEWDGGQYGNMRNDLANQIANRQKFTYDLNGDMLYQQYKDNYINQGKQAMIDTMGQAAALTGGYGNSYAQSVGQQTYQGYLQELNNRVPELYQLALESYNQEGQDLANRFGVASDMYNTEYGQYRDKVGDWNTDYDRAYNIYNNERGNEQTQFNANRQYYSDAYNNLYNQEYSAFADDRSYALQQAQLAEQIRSNKAQEAISWYNAQKSGSGGSSYKTKKTSDDESLTEEELTKASNSSATKTFKASIMTPGEFGRRGSSNTVDGKTKRYDSYNDYVDDILGKWYKDGKLTESETKYLIKYYDLG